MSISIIIPAYEASAFLEDCIKSIISQNLEVEIVVGVDGCDETLNFAKNNTTVKNHSSIFYFKENVGPYVVMNSLLKCCANENIIFFGADDLMIDGLLSEAHKEFSCYDVIRWQFYNFFGSLNQRMDPYMYASGACGIKKELLLRLNGFFPWRISADWEFRARSEYNGARTFYSKECFFLRRVHENSLTQKKDTGLKSEARKIIDEKIKDTIQRKEFINPESLAVAPFEIIDT